MTRTITVNFKDGSKIETNAHSDIFGLMYLENGISLNIMHGTLYREKGNIICGEDITDLVDTIDVRMKY